MVYEFLPPRRSGILFQGGVILVMLLAGGYFFYRATLDQTGLDFLLHMLIALVILAPSPLLLYRLYALLNATYTLRREGLMLRWGLRREDIPLSQIEWMRPAAELGFRLPLPWLKWPGAILGTRQVGELGTVEFLSANLARMILVATDKRVYAISPAESNQFLSQFSQMSELGSLVPLEAQSVYPAVLLGRVMEDRLARILILAGFGAGLLHLAAVVIAIPGLDLVLWPGSSDLAPAERMLLLPVLNGMVWLFNLVLGIFLYRRGGDLKMAAHLLWGNAILIGILMLIVSLLLIF